MEFIIYKFILLKYKYLRIFRIFYLIFFNYKILLFYDKKNLIKNDSDIANAIISYFCHTEVRAHRNLNYHNNLNYRFGKNYNELKKQLRL
jgi:hypothetical protein